MFASKEGKVVKVGIAQMDVVKSPDTIRTSGLGSCVGVVLYDETKTGIQGLLEMLLVEGAQKYRLKAKIAGGAQMFQFASDKNMMRIGPRNVEAVKKVLKELGIPLIAEDTGGNSGRTIEFDPDTSKLMIRTVNKGVSEI